MKTVLWTSILTGVALIVSARAEFPDVDYWDISILDSGASVMGSDFVIDHNQMSHVSYQRYPNLKHAFQYDSGSGKAWQIDIVDTEGTAGAYDGNTAIALPYYSDLPCIVYCGQYLGSTWLKRAIKNGDGSWGFINVDFHGRFPSMASSPYAIGKIGASYYYNKSNDLAFIDYSNPWDREIVASTGDSGKYSDIAIGPDGLWRMVYYDGAHIRYAIESGTGWYVGPQAFKTDNPQKWSSLAVDCFNQPHVVYSASNGVTYAVKTNTFWTMEVIDTNTARSVSITTDHYGQPHIAYCTWYNDQIRYIRKKGNYWTSPMIIQSNVYSFSTTIQLDSNSVPRVVYVGNALLQHAQAVMSPNRPDNDFDGDGRSDLGCYYDPTGMWYVKKSTAGMWQNQFGYGGTLPVTGDFDGDGICDYGVYHAPSGMWYVNDSSGGYRQTQFGYAGTVPVTGDFDGDGRTDYGVYHPDSGNWFIQQSSAGLFTTQFGFGGTQPVVGDLDGDGRDDYGCYWPQGGWWFVMRSKDGLFVLQFGYDGTKAFTGDFDGDGFDDGGIYDPAAKMMYLSMSSLGIQIIGPYIHTGMMPVVGDWDGDGADDYGCYHNGNWYLMLSMDGVYLDALGFGGTRALGAPY
ncbi:MAG: VCBS repeat-containing protein [Spartobacteria bacterium]|nr:VCBS repeat-containing protein [Spartobacteria bacterium]